MAKVSLTKLTPQKKIEDVNVDIFGNSVVIKQYLPITEKVTLLEWVLQFVFDEQGFASPLRIDVFTNIALIKFYTNISLTDTALNNLNKTYDLLKMNNIFEQVKTNIPKEELNDLMTLINSAIEFIIKYNTSILGILNTVRKDYDATELDANKIANILQDEKALATLKGILETMG